MCFALPCSRCGHDDARVVSRSQSAHGRRAREQLEPIVLTAQIPLQAAAVTRSAAVMNSISAQCSISLQWTRAWVCMNNAYPGRW